MATPQRVRKHISPRDNSFISLLLFWILPFILINTILFVIFTSAPKFDVVVDDPGDFASANVSIKVKSIFPNNGVTATLAGEPFELTKGDDGTYTATAYNNGTLQVEVVNKNGINKIIYETISCIDDAPPTLTQADTASGFVSLYVDDTQSGVNYNSIYAVTTDSATIYPSLMDQGESLVAFYYDTKSIEIHACDNVGHETIATFGDTNVANADLTDGEQITEEDIEQLTSQE